MALNFNIDEPAAEEMPDKKPEPKPVNWCAGCGLKKAACECETPPANRDPNLIETKTAKGALYSRRETPVVPAMSVTIPAGGLDLDRAKKALEWVEPKLDEFDKFGDQFLTVTDETTKAASDYVLSVAALKKSLTETVEAMVDIPNKYVRDLRGIKNYYTKRLDGMRAKAERALKDLALKKYKENQAAEAKAREAEAKRRAELEAQQKAEGAQPTKQAPLPVFNLPPDTEGPVRTEKGTLSTTISETFEIVDESQLPREYLTADVPKIKAAWTAGIQIPGVKTVQKATMSARTR